jgi:hypothetical protein
LRVRDIVLSMQPYAAWRETEADSDARRGALALSPSAPARLRRETTARRERRRLAREQRPSGAGARIAADDASSATRHRVGGSDAGVSI